MKLKGILLLNGEPYRGEIDGEGAVVYCCDGAYDWAHGKVKIDKNVGDFDSLSYVPEPPPEEVYPSEKDFTDGEIALGKMIDDGVDEVVLYGGGGLREDHFIGNLHLLYRALKRGVRAKMITNYSQIFLAEGKLELRGIKGKTLSVLPFGGALHIMDSKGLKYAEPPRIDYGECIGVSNVAEEDCISVTFAQGCCALIVINGGAL